MLKPHQQYDANQQLNDLHAALERDPQSPHIHQSLGRIYWEEMGNVNKAIEHYAAAVEADPTDRDAREGLFRAMRHRNWPSFRQILNPRLALPSLNRQHLGVSLNLFFRSRFQIM